MNIFAFSSQVPNWKWWGPVGFNQAGSCHAMDDKSRNAVMIQGAACYFGKGSAKLIWQSVPCESKSFHAMDAKKSQRWDEWRGLLFLQG